MNYRSNYERDMPYVFVGVLLFAIALKYFVKYAFDIDL